MEVKIFYYVDTPNNIINLFSSSYYAKAFFTGKLSKRGLTFTDTRMSLSLNGVISKRLSYRNITLECKILPETNTLADLPKVL